MRINKSTMGRIAAEHLMHSGPKPALQAISRHGIAELFRDGIAHARPISGRRPERLPGGRSSPHQQKSAVTNGRRITQAEKILTAFQGFQWQANAPTFRPTGVCAPSRGDAPGRYGRPVLPCGPGNRDGVCEPDGSADRYVSSVKSSFTGRAFAAQCQFKSTQDT